MKTLFHPLSAKAQNKNNKFIYIETIYDEFVWNRDFEEKAPPPLATEAMEVLLNDSEKDNKWDFMTVLRENGNYEDRRIGIANWWTFVEEERRKNSNNDSIAKLAEANLSDSEYFNAFTDIVEVRAGKRKPKDVGKSIKIETKGNYHLTQYAKLKEIAAKQKQRKMVQRTQLIALLQNRVDGIVSSPPVIEDGERKLSETMIFVASKTQEQLVA